MRSTRYSKHSLCIATLLALLLLPFSAPLRSRRRSKSEDRLARRPDRRETGDIAEIKVPEGYRFAGADGTRKFLELTQKPIFSSLPLVRGSDTQFASVGGF